MADPRHKKIGAKESTMLAFEAVQGEPQLEHRAARNAERAVGFP